MNAPVRAPHIAYADPEALFQEIRQVLWGLGVHAECGKFHAELHDREGLYHDLCCLRDCLNRAVFLYKETSGE